MAKKQPARRQPVRSSRAPQAGTQSFSKGMIKDIHESIQPTTNWTHARNVANHSSDGDLGVIGNEPANLRCAEVPYTIIGCIHKYSDEWIVYSTDNTNSEIGLFDDSKCEYTTIVSAPCLNFKTSHLITGAAKENYDCSWQVYWDDGLNPSRTLNLDDIPTIQIETTAPGDNCVTFIDDPSLCFTLDCERLRLAPLLTVPCIKLSKAEDGGQLRNGTYQAYIAYVVNEQRVTDYLGISNLQSLWDHAGTGGSLNIEVSNLDREEFEYFELVILSNNQNNQVAKKIGIYNTDTKSISIDFIDQALPVVPLEIIPLRNPAYEKSDAMFVVNDYLIRKGPETQFDFNYQPLANKIQANWVVKEYPANYYHKGGNAVGFMRDEQYAFFIRWIYNTGEISKSYHIPGRAPNPNGVTQFGDIVDEVGIAVGPASIGGDEYNFQAYNTAFVTQGAVNQPSGDGIILSRGKMAYWESTERYDSRRPDIWAELCGEHIRHHKMPTEEIHETLQLTNSSGTAIRVLGVEFENIERPKFNDGSYIPNIVGYEILRGSREGAKSILGKGIFKNMRKYSVPDAEDLLQSGVQGLYPNYPFNDLRDDIFFSERETEGCNTFSSSLTEYKPLQGYTKDVFTFHSPELMFRKPFLNAYETRLYGQLDGRMSGTFYPSENHPQHKLLRNGAAILAGIIGVGYAIGRVRGDKTFGVRGPNTHISSGDPEWGLVAGTGAVIPFTPSGAAVTLATAASGALGVSSLVGAILSSLIEDLADIGGLFTGDSLWTEFNLEAQNALAGLSSIVPGVNSGHTMERYTKTHPTGNLPGPVAVLLSQSLGKTNIATGGDEMIELFYNLAKPHSHAMKMNSYGQYTNFDLLTNGSVFRSKTLDSNYIDSTFQLFDEGKYKVNNLFRPTTVIVSQEREFGIPSVQDKSRFAIGGDNDKNTISKLKKPEIPRGRPISCLYGALKFNFENQYGQLDQIKQVVMRGCSENIDLTAPEETKYTSQPIFDGDTYIGRYTEKCIMPIFTDFLNGQPDGFNFDYRNKINLPFPRFWMDTQKFDMTDMAQEIMSLSLANSNNALPTDLYYLDRGDTCGSSGLTNLFSSRGNPKNPAFALRYAYMYTHISGISDFFVESEINLAHRDWDDRSEEKIYSSYYNNNVKDLLHADIIKEDNFYKYDYSLSASRFITNLASNGVLQPRDYDPLVAEKCHDYYPKRLIYSNRAMNEQKKDFWRVFLPNNYKDFKNRVTSINSLNKTGAMMFFPYQSPAIFQGVDTLKSDMGTEVYLGDGGLFAREPQNIMNSEKSIEYGSCESLRSVVNTPSGLFWISQAQGKIFQYAGRGAQNIANQGMKWWFNKYLPSQLIAQLPELEEYTLGDNPVAGVGCQTVYDANDDIVYFCKKDFRIKDEYVGKIIYDTTDTKFYYTDGPRIEVQLTDPLYFEDCSWTISYDPKVKAWISFHDWHPELSVSSINHFLTTKKNKKVTDGLCPPGFTYNSSTQLCECGGTETNPAPITVEEVVTNISGGPLNCLVDIVIAMDVSGSTNTGNRIQAQRAFVQAFLNDPTISARMAAGDIQVGFTRWAATQISTMNPNGFSMDNQVTPAQVSTYYSAGSGGLTDICTAVNGGAGVLFNKVQSRLGDRSADPNFRDVLIVITDANGNTDGANPQNCGPGGTQIGCQYQNQANYDVIAVFCDPTNPTPPGGGQALLNAITCNDATKQFTIAANQTTGPNSPSAIANDVTGVACGTDYQCECPPGFTLVYPDANGNHTQATGTCTVTDPATGAIAPICRRVICECPPPTGSLGTVTETGVCDDFFLLGDPAYVNPTPKMCTVDTLSTAEPAPFSTSFWRHNYRCDEYANFYGVDYPWEVEVVNHTGQLVTTLRSIEYHLESFIYKGDMHNGCNDDKWHDLDYNFDEVIIHNTEQVSGKLVLSLTPKEQPIQALAYPIINATDINILYSKEEQKYRFNQFWDITNDRGEFSTAQQTIFNTQPNGYIRDLNINNLNYDKLETQRKKFRHYYNKMLLRKTKSEGRKMILRLNNFKFQTSQR